MMKLFFLTSIFCLLLLFTTAQKKNIYNPLADASADIEKAIASAKTEGKFVLIQGGGDWCSWCIKFHHFCKSDKQIDSLIQRNFIWYHLNYSKENLNAAIFKKYDFPQRFGFPVFIILNERGDRIHTQNSEYLEDGKSGYDKERVLSFLEMWSPSALNPAAY